MGKYRSLGHAGRAGREQRVYGISIDHFFAHSLQFICIRACLNDLFIIINVLTHPQLCRLLLTLFINYNGYGPQSSKDIFYAFDGHQRINNHVKIAAIHYPHHGFPSFYRVIHKDSHRLAHFFVFTQETADSPGIFYKIGIGYLFFRI